jgi:hypothetical protein
MFVNQGLLDVCSTACQRMAAGTMQYASFGKEKSERFRFSLVPGIDESGDRPFDFCSVVSPRKSPGAGSTLF